MHNAPVLPLVSVQRLAQSGRRSLFRHAPVLVLLALSLLFGACTTSPSASVSPTPSASLMLASENPTATLRVGELIQIWIASGYWDFNFAPEGIVELVPDDPATVNKLELGLRAIAPGVVVVTVTRPAGDQPTERYTVTVLP
jgi:hypothetical protein